MHGVRPLSGCFPFYFGFSSVGPRHHACLVGKWLGYTLLGSFSYRNRRSSRGSGARLALMNTLILIIHLSDILLVDRISPEVLLDAAQWGWGA